MALYVERIEACGEDPDADSFFINLRCADSGKVLSTRISSGRSFDEALEKSLKSCPEQDFTMGTVSRWDRRAQAWRHFTMPSLDNLLRASKRDHRSAEQTRHQSQS